MRFPLELKPELPKLVDSPPAGSSWLHETKYDGYRIIASIKNGEVKLSSRNGLDWTRRFVEVVHAVEKLGLRSAVLDGEIIVAPKSIEKGASEFTALQNRLSAGKTDGFLYMVFDLLYVEGFDLTEVPLLARKRLLSEVMKKQKRILRSSPYRLAGGSQIYLKSCKADHEGVISKRIDSPYISGRSHDWVKSKCRHEDEFVIGGFTDPKGCRQGFGALLVGFFQTGQTEKLFYSGRVGTGFNAKILVDLEKKLAKIETGQSPFSNAHNGLSPSEKHGAHYVRPKYVAQVRYIGWGSHHRLRHPVFLGLREDKKPRDVTYGG